MHRMVSGYGKLSIPIKIKLSQCTGKLAKLLLKHRFVIFVANYSKLLKHVCFRIQHTYLLCYKLHIKLYINMNTN